MSSWLIQATRAPASTSIRPGLNWKRRTATPDSEPAGPAALRTTALTTRATAVLPMRWVSIAPSFRSLLRSQAGFGLAHGVSRTRRARRRNQDYARAGAVGSPRRGGGDGATRKPG